MRKTKSMKTTNSPNLTTKQLLVVLLELQRSLGKWSLIVDTTQFSFLLVVDSARFVATPGGSFQSWCNSQGN